MKQKLNSSEQNFFAVGMHLISLPQILGRTTRISNCLRLFIRSLLHDVIYSENGDACSSVFCHFPMKRVRFASDFKKTRNIELAALTDKINTSWGSGILRKTGSYHWGGVFLANPLVENCF